MADKFSFKFDSEKMVKAIKAYHGDVKHSMRSAALAGAKVLYEDMIPRVPVSKAPRKVKSKTYYPGTLRKSIYHAFSEPKSSGTRAVYHIGPNKRKAPHWHLIEYGHWTKKVGKRGPLQPKWVPAKPYIRPTWDAKGPAAVEAMKARLRALLAQRRSK